MISTKNDTSYSLYERKLEVKQFCAILKAFTIHETFNVKKISKQDWAVSVWKQGSPIYVIFHDA